MFHANQTFPGWRSTANRGWHTGKNLIVPAVFRFLFVVKIYFLSKVAKSKEPLFSVDLARLVD
jgi:hypothetical protein